MGFPRSGTTLLEQVLAAHPAVVSLDEKPALRPARLRFMEAEDAIDEFVALAPVTRW